MSRPGWRVFRTDRARRDKGAKAPLPLAAEFVVQDDRHGEVLLIRQVTVEQGLDSAGHLVNPTCLVAGLRLIQLDQFDHAADCSGK